MKDIMFKKLSQLMVAMGFRRESATHYRNFIFEGGDDDVAYSYKVTLPSGKNCFSISDIESIFTRQCRIPNFDVSTFLEKGYSRDSIELRMYIKGPEIISS